MDFQQLVAVYAKNYAPYEWKRDTRKFDLFQIGPWLDRVAKSRDDLEFYDICIEYVASLNDAHSYLGLPSTFQASLGFSVDIFDGKVLIDGISRTALPASRYPFQTGDELVSVDGKSAETLIRDFYKYATAANDRSTRREAATMIPNRRQETMPRIVELGETASVVVRRQNGALESYELKWLKDGEPLMAVGPVPTPKTAALLAPRGEFAAEASGPDNREVTPDPPLPAYMEPLQRLRNTRLGAGRASVSGLGARNPFFTARPANFVQRLGRSGSDLFYSGTFEAGGYRIGYIRIPNFSPASQSFALYQFEQEVVYFQANTDGLVIDQMRNPGGDGCYTEELLSRVIPTTFRSIGFEIRATAGLLASFSSSVALAEQMGADQWIIDLLRAMMADVRLAYRENRGRTGAMPLCSFSLDVEPAVDRTGRSVAYTKPLIVLTDEFSASAADMFAAVIQDNARGLLVGMRTMGAGGSVASFDATTYSEGIANVTLTLMTRKNAIATPDFPAAPYVENIGVRPEVEIDYMTRENLMTGGRPFVDAFVAAAVDHIAKSR